MVMSEEIADILERSAEVLSEAGWCQGAFQNEVGQVCAIGARNLAAFGTHVRAVSEVPVHRVVDVDNATRKALGFVNPELLKANRFPGELFVDVEAWNDAPGRTQGEVEDLFRHAAKAVRNGEVEV